jgi:hypothetical protein
MRLTTTDWTQVQIIIEKSDPLLDAYIEQRTWGKKWSQVVAIGLQTREERIVRAALKELGIEEIRSSRPGSGKDRVQVGE